MRQIVTTLCTVLCLWIASPHLANAQEDVRWLWSVRDALDGSQPGWYVMLGAPSELVLRVSLRNFSRGAFDFPNPLGDGVKVIVTSDGEVLPTVVGATPMSGSNVFTIPAGSGIGLNVTLTMPNGEPFQNGTYIVSVDVTPFLRSIRVDGATRELVGKRVDTRRIIVREPGTPREQAHFHEVQGNYYLKTERYREALPHLEQAVQLSPTRWMNNLALGTAYERLGRWQDAISTLEAAFPYWLACRECRGAVVPEYLARAYLAVSRDADAANALRRGRIPEQDIPGQLNRLRTNR